MGFRSFGFPPVCHASYRGLAASLAGLTPAEPSDFVGHTCFRHPLLLRGNSPFVDRFDDCDSDESEGYEGRKRHPRREDVSKCQFSVHDSGLHGWCADFSSKLQSSVGANEIVMTLE